MSLFQFPKKSVKLVTKFWEFLKNFRRNIPEIFLGISWEKFLRNSQKLHKSFFQFPKKFVRLVTKSWEFLKNFQRSICEKFSGISLGKIPEKFSWNFSSLCPLFSSPNNPKNWWPSPENFSGISREIFLSGKNSGILRNFSN